MKCTICHNPVQPGIVCTTCGSEFDELNLEDAE